VARSNNALTDRPPPPRGGLRVSLTLVIESVLASVMFVTLAGYALLGVYNRYVADDYGGVLAVRLRGFWATQVNAYRLWTGRFTSSALTSAAAMLPEGSVRVIPGILIGTWVLVLVVALKYVVPSAGRFGRILLAAGVVYTTLQITPSPFLSIYWRTGSLTYVPSLILAPFLLALICRPDTCKRRRIATIVGAGVVAFLAGGFNETYVVAQTVALALVVAVAVSPYSIVSRSKVGVLAVGLLGSLMALGVLVAAPGNAIRDAAILRVVGHHPSLLDLPRLTAQFTWQFFQSLFSAHWVSLLALAILAGLLAARSRATAAPLRSFSIVGGSLVIGTVLVVASAILPSVFEEVRLTNAYGQIVLVYVCICSAATLGWICGLVFRSVASMLTPAESQAGSRRIAPGLISLAACAFVVVGPILTDAGMIGDLPAIQAWAVAKDAEAASAISAHAAGKPSVIVTPLIAVDNIGVFSHPVYEDLMSDPRFWINEDEAAYYGVVSMATSPTPSA
jgi:hypothetical protein